MVSQRIAVISDIHGNSWALEAVLNDIDRRGVKRVVNLGDCLYGPLMPARTAEIIISRGVATVRGNEDRLIVESNAAATADPTAQFVRDELGDDQLEWLKSLPISRELDGELFLCHGTPCDDGEYLLNEVSTSGVSPRSPEKLELILTGIELPVILCGHDHTQAEVRLPSGRMVVNPGSVGLQAFYDELPAPHGLAANSPHARYSIITRSEVGWSVEHRQLEYEWERAAETASRRGRNDWAHWLLTGRIDPGG